LVLAAQAAPALAVMVGSRISTAARSCLPMAAVVEQVVELLLVGVEAEVSLALSVIPVDHQTLSFPLLQRLGWAAAVLLVMPVMVVMVGRHPLRALVVAAAVQHAVF
jgi:hypothetical protein